MLKKIKKIAKSAVDCFKNMNLKTKIGFIMVSIGFAGFGLILSSCLENDGYLYRKDDK